MKETEAAENHSFSIWIISVARIMESLAVKISIGNIIKNF